MKTKLMLGLMLTAGSIFAGSHFSIGMNIGAPVYGGYYVSAPPPAPIYYYAEPRYARPGYVWVSGYWYPQGRQYRWREGYWTRPPHRGAYWVAPRYERGIYFNGYWRR